MIQKNKTPYHWGPKVTSLQPPQLAMAVCVRATFKLEPGKPLEAIEDPLEQGFMSGDTWADEDPDRLGDLVQHNDFADFKPRADVLLKGTCYPPKGADVACDVTYGLGEWSKTLRVVGPRSYRPGLLLGGGASEPQPFTHMPLTWANAYGGPGYALNPVGKGFASEELPCVEVPGQPATKKGAKRVTPAGFGPLSPLWALRRGKVGKNYGAKWKRTRAPWFSDDFDWTHFNAAPEDQQLDRYPRGDEELRFQNLHPDVKDWRVKLPGLRLRAFVKLVDGTVHEPALYLDTVFADLDAGRLYLTWRGHTPIKELDLTDVGVVLIDEEPLDSQPLPREHYERQLAEFEADPVGLKDAFPPGFVQVAQAIEAYELAVLNDQPPPDLRALAANLPAGCPFPPWMILAAAGDKDPLGIMGNFPPGLLAAAAGHPNPLGAMAGKPELPPESEIKEMKRAIEEAKAAGRPEDALDQVARMGRLLPPDKQPAFHEQLGQAKQAILDAKRNPQVPHDAFQAQPAPPKPPAEQAAASRAKAAADIQDKAPEAAAKLRAAPSADQAVAKALAPLDQVQVPTPQLPKSPVDVKALAAKLNADEAKLRAKGIDHPLLGLFDMGRRLLERAPKPGDFLPPDLSGMIRGLGHAKTSLLSAGISLGALAPLSNLIGRIEAVQAKLPPRPPRPPQAGADLRGQDYSGQDLQNADLRQALLTRARFVGADLRGADLSGADLAQADLSQADLRGAKLQTAKLKEARLVQAQLAGADLIEADLAEADLSGADLSQAKLESCVARKAVLVQAKLEGADLRFANLEQADLRGANLRQADLSLAQLTKAKADQVDLSQTKLDMTSLKKARLCQAVLREATSEMGDFTAANLAGADLRGCRFQKVELGKSNLQGAELSGAALLATTFRDVLAMGARFVQADLSGSATGGQANFQGAVFVGLKGRRSVWLGVDLTQADFSHADLRNTNFMGSRGQEVNFYAARFKGAFLRQMRLKRPVFVAADLCDADLTSAVFVEARFTSANCYTTKFLFCTLDACDFTQANLNGAMFDDPRPPLLGVR